ncbi:MAG: AAA family ATPase, partial [Nitrospira sp.]|nr:AAA family ATPase [Nitrospira sp.]
MIQRIYNLGKLVKPDKVLVIYGPRRAGKTTLLNEFLKSTPLKYKLDSGDNIRTQAILSSQDFTKILEYAEGYNLIAIDEAQQIPNIGMGLKIIVDHIPGVILVATGSSSFDLAGAVGEPITGRKATFTLYPLSQQELTSVYNRYELKERLEEFLVFGSYPEVITANSRKEKINILEEIINSYLLKDVLTL